MEFIQLADSRDKKLTIDLSMHPWLSAQLKSALLLTPLKCPSRIQYCVVSAVVLVEFSFLVIRIFGLTPIFIFKKYLSAVFCIY